MNGELPASLLPLLPHIPAALMVLFRLSGLFVFAPLLGSAAIPARVKVLLALVLTVCVYPMVPAQPPIDLTVASMAGRIGQELLIGIVLGYGASLPLLAIQMGGMMMGQQLGLSLARVFSPTFGEQTEVISRFFFLSALAVFVALNGHQALISVLVESFERIPLGGWSPDISLLEMVVGMLAAMYSLAIRVAAPLLCMVFLETVAMGFVARTVPQLNILSMGFPLRIVAGLTVMVAIIAGMNEAFAEQLRQTMGTLMRFFGG